MTLLASGRTGFLFVLEDNDLSFLALLFNFTGNFSSINVRCAKSETVVTDSYDFIESIFFAFFYVQFLNVDSLAFFDFQLLSASLNNCVHFALLSLI